MQRHGVHAPSNLPWRDWDSLPSDTPRLSRPGMQPHGAPCCGDVGWVSFKEPSMQCPENQAARRLSSDDVDRAGQLHVYVWGIGHLPAGCLSTSTRLFGNAIALNCCRLWRGTGLTSDDC